MRYEGDIEHLNCNYVSVYEYKSVLIWIVNKKALCIESTHFGGWEPLIITYHNELWIENNQVRMYIKVIIT